MGTQERWRLSRRPELDGIRAVAVLLVMACHFDRGQLTEGGVIGVTMFFTLSGFLITSILVAEREERGGLDLRRFYRGRALRLLPALAVLLVVLCLLTTAGLPTRIGPGLALSVVGYASNWFLVGTATHGQVHWSALSHTWSLAIEEQFYLVWPLVCLAALRRSRRRLLIVCGAASGASLVWALASGRSLLCTDVSAYGLLAGGVLAVWMRDRPWSSPRGWWAAVALFPLAAGSLLDREQLGFVITPVLTLVAIWVVVQTNVRWLAAPPLVWVGRRSYGLYLWHVPVAWLVADVRVLPYAMATAAGVAVSFGLCAISWAFVEVPFLRLKQPSRALGGGASVAAAAAPVA
jgi:peptidoglycan/LPS O-acetylase OafA/YrhL